MGKRGPKPTPTATLRLRGSWLVNNRKKEPTPAVESPVMPRGIKDRAAEYWDYWVDIIGRMGVLTEADGTALGRYCKLCARLEEAEEIEDIVKLCSPMAKLEAMFGLSPADRASLKVEEPSHGPKAKDYFA